MFRFRDENGTCVTLLGMLRSRGHTNQLALDSFERVVCRWRRLRLVAHCARSNIPRQQLVEEVDATICCCMECGPICAGWKMATTLLVPSLGPQVTVDGMVRRPAIYELHGESSLADVLELAGGILPTATLRHIEVQRVEAHEKRSMLTVELSPAGDADSTSKQLEASKLRMGNEVHIFPIAPYNEDASTFRDTCCDPGDIPTSKG